MKVTINEEQQKRLKLQPFIYKAIMSKRTSLGDNPAFPPYGDFGFEYDIIKKSYEEADEIINRCIENGVLESKDTDYLISVLSKKVERCKKLEKPIRPQLQKICENIVNRTFSVPSDTVILKCELVGKIKPKNNMRILPEDNTEDGYDFEDVDEVELTNKVILKRRFINSLIQGFSYWLSTDISNWHDEVYNLNNEIWGLWYDIKHISDYLLYVKEEKISEKNPMQMSYVEVKLGRNGKKTIINSQGIIFPYLLRDTFRGFLELFSSHGLPEDNQKAMYIIRKADFLVAEPWDLRFGMGIINLFINNLTKKYGTGLLFNTNRIPFFFSELCKLKTDEFNMVVKNFLLGTKKGKIIAKEMDEKIVHNSEYQFFKNRIQQKNIDTSLISDDISKEELDNYIIRENDMGEMIVYHGSGADFNKFNHKKFLNTGAGSQTFGWGTYVTNDMSVANGYSDASKKSDLSYKAMIPILINQYGFDNQSALEEADLIFMSIYKCNNVGEYLRLMKASQEKIGDDPMFKRRYDVVKQLTNRKSFLYEVDIPEDNGMNYIEWYEHFPKEFMVKILNGFLKVHDKYLSQMADRNYPFKINLYDSIIWMKQNPMQKERMIELLSNDDNYDKFFAHGMYTKNPSTEGKDVYFKLVEIMGSKKAASLFLLYCGFDGIKYPSGTKWKKPDGASKDAYNYVIFDANKVKITNKTVV